MKHVNVLDCINWYVTVLDYYISGLCPMHKLSQYAKVLLNYEILSRFLQSNRASNILDLICCKQQYEASVGATKAHCILTIDLALNKIFNSIVSFGMKLYSWQQPWASNKLCWQLYQ